MTSFSKILRRSEKTITLSACLLAVIFLLYPTLSASQGKAPGAKQKPAALPPVSPPPGSEREDPCEVVEGNTSTPTTPWAKLDQDVTVVLRNVEQCLQDRKAKDASSWGLAIDGKILKKLTAKPNVKESYIKFSLDVNAPAPEDRTAWVDIIRSARQARGSGLSITIFDTGKNEFFRSRQLIVLDLYPWYSKWIVVGMVVLLIAMIGLGARSNLLRDNPAGTRDPNVTLPISLGRVQMAWWFYLVVAGYLYIWLLTGASYTPTGSVLALMGISAATGLTGAIVDRSKYADSTNKRTDLSVKQSALTSRITELEAARPAAGSDLEKELNSKKDELAKSTSMLASIELPQISTTKGWLVDLFCDGDGVSFHRFQMIIWTVVLGIVFVQAVYHQLAMPDFDPTLLGLMGLSAGTYVGFKFPEKTK